MTELQAKNTIMEYIRDWCEYHALDYIKEGYDAYEEMIEAVNLVGFDFPWFIDVKQDSSDVVGTLIKSMN